MSQTYRVVVIDYPGVDPAEAARRVAAKFGISEAAASEFTERLPVIVRDSVDEQQAEVFRRALAEVGAEVQVSPVSADDQIANEAYEVGVPVESPSPEEAHAAGRLQSNRPSLEWDDVFAEINDETADVAPSPARDLASEARLRASGAVPAVDEADEKPPPTPLAPPGPAGDAPPADAPPADTPPVAERQDQPSFDAQPDSDLFDVDRPDAFSGVTDAVSDSHEVPPLGFDDRPKTSFPPPPSLTPAAGVPDASGPDEEFEFEERTGKGAADRKEEREADAGGWISPFEADGNGSAEKSEQTDGAAASTESGSVPVDESGGPAVVPASGLGPRATDGGVPLNISGEAPRLPGFIAPRSRAAPEGAEGADGDDDKEKRTADLYKQLAGASKQLGESNEARRTAIITAAAVAGVIVLGLVAKLALDAMRPISREHEARIEAAEQDLLPGFVQTEFVDKGKFDINRPVSLSVPISAGTCAGFAASSAPQNCALDLVLQAEGLVATSDLTPGTLGATVACSTQDVAAQLRIETDWTMECSFGVMGYQRAIRGDDSPTETLLDILASRFLNDPTPVGDVQSGIRLAYGRYVRRDVRARRAGCYGIVGLSNVGTELVFEVTGGNGFEQRHVRNVAVAQFCLDEAKSVDLNVNMTTGRGDVSYRVYHMPGRADLSGIGR